MPRGKGCGPRHHHRQCQSLCEWVEPIGISKDASGQRDRGVVNSVALRVALFELRVKYLKTAIVQINAQHATRDTQRLSNPLLKWLLSICLQRPDDIRQPLNLFLCQKLFDTIDDI